MYGLFNSTMKNQGMVWAIKAFIVGQFLVYMIMEILSKTGIKSCTKYF